MKGRSHNGKEEGGTCNNNRLEQYALKKGYSEVREQRLNNFLDYYCEYFFNEQSEGNRKCLLRAAELMEKIDPKFCFEIEEEEDKMMKKHEEIA